MRIRALFLLSILTFGCLSEAKPPPTAIKVSLILPMMVLRAVFRLSPPQNTQALIHRDISHQMRAIRGMRTESLILGNLLQLNARAFLQARPIGSTSLVTISRLYRIEAANTGLRAMARSGDELAMRFFIETRDRRLIGAGMRALESRITDGELTLLATALAAYPGERRTAGQAPSSRGQEELFTDDTHRAVAIFTYLGNRPFQRDDESGSTIQPWADVRSHSALLQNLFRRRNNSITSPDDVLNQSANNIARDMGSTGNASYMGIAAVVTALNRDPDMSAEVFVDHVENIARTRHNHPHSIAAATAIALAARSCILHRVSLRDQTLTRLEFAEATIASIRQFVRDDHFLYYLGIVEYNLYGNNSHRLVMSQLNSDPSYPVVVDDNGVLNNMQAPNTAAAVLHFLFSGTRSQQALLNLVEQYTQDSGTVGATLMALSALREGGIMRNEFTVDEIRRLLEHFPEWVNIERNPDNFLIDQIFPYQDPSLLTRILKWWRKSR